MASDRFDHIEYFVEREHTFSVKEFAKKHNRISFFRVVSTFI